MSTNQPTIKGRDWFRSSVAGMASYLDAAAIVSTGTALVLYQGSFGLTSGTIGLLSSLLTFSIAVGALIGGRAGDRFGRRRVFMLTMIMLAAGACLLAAAPNAALLFPGIVLVGLAAGADLPVSIALISEEAPPGAKGKLVGLSQLLWYAGILVSQGLGILVGGLGAAGGRILYGHIAVAAVLVLLLRLRVPESRQWLAERQHASRPTATTVRSSARQLFNRRYFPAFLSLGLFYCLANLAANTKGQFGTYMYVKVADSTVQTASTIGLIAQIVSIGLALIFMRIVDQSYRMKWYTAGAVAFVSYFGIPAAFGVSVWTLAIGNFVGTLGLAFAFEGIYKVWTQEKFPTLLRSTAQGATLAFARVFAALAALWTPMLLDVGPQFLFGTLTAVVGIAMLIGYAVNRQQASDIDAKQEASKPVRSAL